MVDPSFFLILPSLGAGMVSQGPLFVSGSTSQTHNHKTLRRNGDAAPHIRDSRASHADKEITTTTTTHSCTPTLPAP